mmetsp:Transcript_726/g.964  ORF Transcript_726/g.964 Transcript_726/m.964 type:complete len:115 (+) Transcript_726:93-437(+)
MTEEVKGSKLPDENLSNTSWSLFDIKYYLNIPCLADTLGVSTTTAAAFAAHSYRKHRSLLRAGDMGVAVLCATGILSWSVCRLQKKRIDDEEKKELVEALQKMKDDHRKKRESR